MNSAEDVTRLSLLQKVTDAGRPISDVVELDNAALLELINDDQQTQQNIATLTNAVFQGRHPLSKMPFKLSVI